MINPMRKIETNSIYFRLLATFLLIMVPIVAAGIAIFQWERTTIQSQTEESTMKNVSFLKNTLESNIENVKLLQYNFTRDNALTSLITQGNTLPAYEYYTMVSTLQERLNIVKNSNDFIGKVTVFIPSIQHEISTDSSYTKIDSIMFQKRLKMHVESKYPLVFTSSQVITTSIYPLVASEKRPPQFLCEVILSENRLRDFLDNFENYSDSDTALYDYSSRQWVFGKKSGLSDLENTGLKGITDNPKDLNTQVTLGRHDYFAVSAYSKYLNVSIVQCVPVEDVFRTPNVYRWLLAFYVMLSAAIFLIYAQTAYRFVKYPINVILKAFRRLQKGDMSVRVLEKGAGEFGDLYSGFNKATDRLNELIDRVYKQELYAKKAELKQLQSQINPHFLYNSYFMLSRMIKDRDAESAEELSSYLGTYFEYITRNASEEAPLWREREHARSYAMVQQMRFSERLRVEIGELPEAWREFAVPRLLLQPLVENSLKHGMDCVTRCGLLRVAFSETEGGLRITVEDSGNSLTDEDIEAIREGLKKTDDKAETTGMVNVHRRLQLRYGPGSGLRVSRSELGGLKTEITIFAAPETKKE